MRHHGPRYARAMSTVAFLGLGVMGGEMAGHLLKMGHVVRAYNRSADRAARWAARFPEGVLAASPAEAARGADFVFSCVGADPDVRAVLLGPGGAHEGLAPGALVCDHTTASAEVAREVASALAAKGVGFVDAPVSGGQQGAVNGQLTIMCGGSEADFARVEPMLAAYALRCLRLGPVGSGQLTKMVNQLCVAGVVAGLAEGMRFAELAGLDVAAVFDVVGKGAASSWQMVHRHVTMMSGEFEHGFAVDWMRKDLALCRAEAARVGAELPIAELVDGHYAEVQAMGGGRWDTSSLVARLRARTPRPAG